MIKSKVVIKNLVTKSLVIEYKKFDDTKAYLNAMYNTYLLYNGRSNIDVKMFTYNCDIRKYVLTFDLVDFKDYESRYTKKKI